MFKVWQWIFLNFTSKQNKSWVYGRNWWCSASPVFAIQVQMYMHQYLHSMNLYTCINMISWMDHNITDQFNIYSQNTCSLYMYCIRSHIPRNNLQNILSDCYKNHKRKIYERIKQIWIPIVSVGCIAGSTVGSKVAISFRSEITGECCFSFIIYFSTLSI